MDIRSWGYRKNKYHNTHVCTYVFGHVIKPQIISVGMLMPMKLRTFLFSGIVDIDSSPLILIQWRIFATELSVVYFVWYVYQLHFTNHSLVIFANCQGKGGKWSMRYPVWSDTPMIAWFMGPTRFLCLGLKQRYAQYMSSYAIIILLFKHI